MHISKQTDYALRTLMFLAMQDQNTLCSISQVSEVFAISRNHLVKVVNRLGQEGYLETIRGKGGGIRLARAAQQINVGDVISKMELSGEIVDCKTGPCRFLGNCRLRAALDDAVRAFIDSLATVTIADLVDRQAVSVPISWR